MLKQKDINQLYLIVLKSIDLFFMYILIQTNTIYKKVII